MNEMLILVDDLDNPIGICEKMAAHQQALMHRAFSIFIFDSEGRMLVQRRALSKYHSAGLWTNTCCSHPRPGETTLQAAKRRLHEELGFSTDLQWLFSFTYEASFDNGLTEREFDHVYIGYYQSAISPDPSEVCDYAYRSIEDLSASISNDPGRYTVWFRYAFPLVIDHCKRSRPEN